MLTRLSGSTKNVIYGLYCSCHDYEIRYVGLTKNSVMRRLYDHRSAGRTHRNHTRVTRWIAKHGPENIQASILEVGGRDQLTAMEFSWIAELRAQGKDLLNLTRGGTRRPETTGSWGVKLSPKDVLEIRRLRNLGTPVAEIAKSFQINRETVGNIWRGESWAWVGGPIYSGTREIDFDLIRTMLADGRGNLDISEATGLATGTISKMRTGQLYPEMGLSGIAPSGRFACAEARDRKYPYGYNLTPEEMIQIFTLADLGYSVDAISSALGFSRSRVWKVGTLASVNAKKVADRIGRTGQRFSREALTEMPPGVLESAVSRSKDIATAFDWTEREEQKNAEV